MLASEAGKRYLSPTFPPSEIASTIRGAYLRNNSQFGVKKEKFARVSDMVTLVTLCHQKTTILPKVLILMWLNLFERKRPVFLTTSTQICLTY